MNCVYIFPTILYSEKKIRMEKVDNIVRHEDLEASIRLISDHSLYRKYILKRMKLNSSKTMPILWFNITITDSNLSLYNA